MTSAEIHAKACEIGKLAVRMTTSAGSGHPSSALSIAHLVADLMFRKMRWDPADPWNLNADRLVLSEGHAVPAVYAAYAMLGGVVGKDPESARALTRDELDQLRARDSVLDGHPNPAEGFPFFDAATGSLGMGLSVAAGLGLAARRDNTPRRVYCLIGDGESREGQIWEAADFIADYELTNVCAILNCNHYGQAGDVSNQQSAERLKQKFVAAGWRVETIDGHDPAQIAKALDEVDNAKQPLAIIANTVKGWGVDALLDGGNWHGKPLPESELEAANASLDQACAKAGGKPDSGATAPPMPTKAAKPNRACPREAAWPSFTDAMKANGFGGALEKGKLATRRVYGAALKVAGDLLPQVAALDADVSNSTFANIFQAAHPDRFFECKIAEQNMVSVAAGMSAAGHIPFASSFGKFLSRAVDQIELANISRANIKLVGSHSGVTLAADGPSQMGVVDVAIFHALASVRGDDRESPLAWLFHPADAVSAYACVKMMVDFRGMCYLRTIRADLPLLYPPDATFTPGVVNTLQPGEHLALIGAGYGVHVALETRALLAKQNIRAAVIDAFSLPIRRERLIEAITKAGGRAITIEDNYGAGLGSAVAEIAADHGGLRVRTLSCQRIPKSTRDEAEALDYVGLSPQHVADQALAFLRS